MGKLNAVIWIFPGIS